MFSAEPRRGFSFKWTATSQECIARQKQGQDRRPRHSPIIVHEVYSSWRSSIG
jgi:hypothetical protein